MVGYKKTFTRFKNREESSLKSNQTVDYDKIANFYEIDTAVVVRVITSLDDPFIENIEGSNLIGSILCKPVNSSKNMGDDTLILAYPLDPNVKQYPVKNETVIIGEYGITPIVFYRTLNYYNSPNYNGNKKFNSSVGIGNLETEQDTGGQAFSSNRTILTLQPNPGDTVIQGRFGSSIRMTNLNDDVESSYSPGIFISNDTAGKVVDSRGNVLLKEDVNLDGSSIHMTSGEFNQSFVPNLYFDFAKNVADQQTAYRKRTTYREDIGKEDLPDQEEFSYNQFSYPTTLDGNQLILSSDRLILNSKLNEMLIYGKDQIGIFSDSKVSIDSRSGIDISSPNSSFRVKADNVYMNSPNIHLGIEEDKSEPVINGSTFLNYLDSFMFSLLMTMSAMKDSFKAADDANQLKIPGLVGTLENFISEIEESFIMNDDLRNVILNNKVYVGNNARWDLNGEDVE